MKVLVGVGVGGGFVVVVFLWGLNVLEPKTRTWHLLTAAIFGADSEPAELISSGLWPTALSPVTSAAPARPAPSSHLRTLPPSVSASL